MACWPKLIWHVCTLNISKFSHLKQKLLKTNARKIIMINIYLRNWQKLKTIGRYKFKHLLHAMSIYWVLFLLEPSVSQFQCACQHYFAHFFTLNISKVVFFPHLGQYSIKQCKFQLRTIGVPYSTAPYLILVMPNTWLRTWHY